jgi:hypothetical protein
MTLMSVFWDEGRADLERFAREATAPAASGTSPYNHFIKPSPDQLLRVGVGLGLKRARLENVYAVLRGRDAATGEVDPQKRDAQFDILSAAQARALNNTNWHRAGVAGAVSAAGLSLAGRRRRAHRPSCWRRLGSAENCVRLDSFEATISPNSLPQQRSTRLLMVRNNVATLRRAALVLAE